MQKSALLINPPQHCLAQALRIWRFDYSANFPLGLLRLSAFLKDRGYRVDYLDAFNVYSNTPEAYEALFVDANVVRQAKCGNYEREGIHRPVYHVGLSKEEIRSRLLELAQPPDEVYISSIFTWSWQTTHDCVQLVKSAFPRTRVILGGIYPTLCPEHAQKTGADEIVRGYLPEVQAGRLDVELLDCRAVRDGVAIKSSIGCPNDCSYCAVHLLEGRKLSFRDPADVVDEMAFLHAEVGIRKFYFWESNILIQAQTHLLDILSRLKKRGLSFTLLAPEGFQPNLLTREIASALKESGFRQISLALETSDPERTARSARPSGWADVEKAVSLLREGGFSGNDILVVLLVAQPGQLVDSVLTDIIQVFRVGARVSFLVYSPIPGTRDFVDYASLFSERPLEDLDSFLYPLAHPGLTVTQIDTILHYFHSKYFPLERIMASRTDDPIIRRMQELIPQI